LAHPGLEARRSDFLKFAVFSFWNRCCLECTQGGNDGGTGSGKPQGGTPQGGGTSDANSKSLCLASSVVVDLPS